jgi:hypothetical protein
LIGAFATSQPVPSAESVSSSAVKEISRFILGVTPAARSARTAINRLAMDPFMSAVPRPYIHPRSIAPLKGLPCFHFPDTGTTS